MCGAVVSFTRSAEDDDVLSGRHSGAEGSL